MSCIGFINTPINHSRISRRLVRVISNAALENCPRFYVKWYERESNPDCPRGEPGSNTLHNRTANLIFLTLLL